MATAKQLKNLTERRHPDYAALLPHWQFMEMSYTGGRQWFTDNIFQYLKEGDKEYADRVKRAYRFNHTREVVDLVNKYLFRGEISRKEEDAPQSVKDFWKKATRQGLSIDELMRIASQKASIGGRPWIVVDNAVTVIPEEASQADVQDTEIYAYVVSPIDVLDMSYDEKGELLWIVIREYFRDDGDPLVSSGLIVERYRLWTRDEWILVGPEKAGGRVMKLLDMGYHGLGEVPVIKCDHVISNDLWSSPALIADIAYLDRATANYASNLDAIIQDQTFSQLAMPAQNVLPGDDAYNKIMEMGTKRIFLYDGEVGKGPEYLSPDPKQAQLLIAAIQQIINEIYHSVGLAGERTKQDNSKGIDNSSGVAKSIDFERVTALLIAKADSLELVENKLARLVTLWAGDKEPSNDLVEYPDEFDVTGLGDELNVAMQLSLIDVPESLRSEQLKSLVEKLFPAASQDLLDKLKADVDAWAKDLKANKSALNQANQAAANAGSNLLSEAQRNRSGSGQKQSDTKTQAAKG